MNRSSRQLPDGGVHVPPVRACAVRSTRVAGSVEDSGRAAAATSGTPVAGRSKPSSAATPSNVSAYSVRPSGSRTVRLSHDDRWVATARTPTRPEAGETSAGACPAPSRDTVRVVPRTPTTSSWSAPGSKPGTGVPLRTSANAPPLCCQTSTAPSARRSARTPLPSSALRTISPAVARSTRTFATTS
ncbi:hypothetical protein [Amycolatopsis sp. DG1A-15b]|uniref:hypothetical protein n=1 Tax=Amycolatopsis sp. DG1A-15b TaxID=3052846 RepID=UPI00255BE102|nr:hypothetical protein [Amycolatopsis sp. DG1A-15b]WIX88728.1 hypothetical protein QRY02_47785 [Amycolatopsis sp. DG1A-15b]